MIKIKLLKENILSGLLNDKEKEKYLGGNCLRFALALASLIPDSNIVSVIIRVGYDEAIGHVAIQIGNKYVDANGLQTRGELIKNSIKFFKEINGADIDEIRIVSQYKESWWDFYDGDEEEFEQQQQEEEEEDVNNLMDASYLQKEGPGMTPYEDWSITLSNARSLLSSINISHN